MKNLEEQLYEFRKLFSLWNVKVYDECLVYSIRANERQVQSAIVEAYIIIDDLGINLTVDRGFSLPSNTTIVIKEKALN